MALPSVPYDFDIILSHVDRGFDRRLVFKTARHPSESLERLWLRVIAYCWKWEERLGFGPGLGDPEAPDLEVLDFTGERTLWMRVGKADPAKIQRAADRNSLAKVAVLFESPVRLRAFREQAAEEGIARLESVELAAIEPGFLAELASSEERRNKLTLTIVGDHLYAERAGKAFDGPLEGAGG
jgi:uncharacterized protein YaeQ